MKDIIAVGNVPKLEASGEIEKFPFTEQDYYQGVLYLQQLLDENPEPPESQAMYNVSARLLVAYLKNRWDAKHNDET